MKQTSHPFPRTIFSMAATIILINGWIVQISWKKIWSILKKQESTAFLLGFFPGQCWNRRKATTSLTG